MSPETVIEITKKELGTLKEFLKTVKEERDAIISFSLEGIIRENNRKEEILKKLEYLEVEKEKLLKEIPDHESLLESKTWASLHSEIDATMKEVRIALEKNMRLLSFSMDHVKTTIEKIIGFINQATYGKKRERISFLLSKEV
jgi:flagellar biosynthesis/type III secretory pathway chaperone